MSNPTITTKPRQPEAENDELTLGKETIADLDPTDDDARDIRGGLGSGACSGGWGCTDTCGC